MTSTVCVEKRGGGKDPVWIAIAHSISQTEETPWFLRLFDFLLRIYHRHAHTQNIEWLISSQKEGKGPVASWMGTDTTSISSFRWSEKAGFSLTRGTEPLKMLSPCLSWPSWPDCVVSRSPLARAAHSRLQIQDFENEAAWISMICCGIISWDEGSQPAAISAQRRGTRGLEQLSVEDWKETP